MEELGCGGFIIALMLSLLSLLFDATIDTRFCVISADARPVTVREGPGTNRVGIGTIPRYTQVLVVGQAKASDGSLWWKVALPKPDGRTVWVSQSDLEPFFEDDFKNVPQVTPPPLVVRSTPRAINTPIKSKPPSGSGAAAPTRP